MKKTLIVALLGFSALAQAHEVWVATPAQLASNSVLKADLAYGDYPYVEKIPEKRLAIFPPMELINQDGEMQTLVQKGENYQYQSEKPLKDGSYWVTATYKTNFLVTKIMKVGKWITYKAHQMHSIANKLKCLVKPLL